jgi:hypothetical protein
VLVRCQSCGVTLDHKLRRCPLCKADLVLADEQLVDSLVEDAQQWQRRGIRSSQIREQLLSVTNLSESQVDEVLKRVRVTRKRDSRAQGRQLLFSGGVLVLVSLLIAFVSFAMSGGGVSLWPISALVFGVAMMALGQIKLLTGWNVTGNDEC